MPRIQKPAAVKKSGLAANIERTLLTSCIGVGVTLIGTGIVSMMTMYTDLAKLTEAETRTEQQLSRHLDHSVDRDVYEKRDTAIQRQLNDKASKDELSELRAEVKEQLLDLKEMIHTLNEGFSAGRRK